MSGSRVVEDRTRQRRASEDSAPQKRETGTRVEFEQFLDRELEGLARYARILTGDRERAHDVLADSVLKAQQAWPRIARTDHPAAYVRRIITNTLVSQQRSWFSRSVSTTRTGTLPDRPVTPGTGRVDDRDELDGLLQALPERQRTAVVLRYYLDLDDDGIAAEMRCSVSAVRSYISRGLAALRTTPSPADDQEDRHGRG